MQTPESVTLLEALGLYVSSFKAKDVQAKAQQELHRFVSWYGSDKPVQEIRPVEIEEYSEQAAGSGSVGQASERLREVRKFLTFARKKGLIQENLAKHLRIRKGKSRAGANARGAGPRVIEITKDGHAQLTGELEKLRAERTPIAAEIRRAAADKDVRENVPLEAAREQLGHVESRITEIESTLKAAVVVDTLGKKRGQAVAVGAKVLLKDLDSGRETRYSLVSAFESNPLERKISDVSPVGSAMLGRTSGQEIEVDTPRGKLRYRILRVTS